MIKEPLEFKLFPQPANANLKVQFNSSLVSSIDVQLYDLKGKLITELINQKLGNEEMREMVDMLFACQNPNYSPFGKLIVSIIKTDELEKRFI